MYLEKKELIPADGLNTYIKCFLAEKVTLGNK